jgi:hypothetical protein
MTPYLYGLTMLLLVGGAKWAWPNQLSLSVPVGTEAPVSTHIFFGPRGIAACHSGQGRNPYPQSSVFSTAR